MVVDGINLLTSSQLDFALTNYSNMSFQLRVLMFEDIEELSQRVLHFDLGDGRSNMIRTTVNVRDAAVPL